MIFFLLSIFCSTSLALLFKLSERYKVSLIRLIALNYLACAVIGFFLTGTALPQNSAELHTTGALAVLIGCLFIGTFYLLGATTKQLGVTGAVIAHKLSLLIPVVLGFVYYNDSLHAAKIAGILLAFPAIYFATVKVRDTGSAKKTGVWLALLLFLASGATDSIVKFVQHHYLQHIDFNFFLLILFCTAGLISAIIVVVSWVKNGFELSKPEALLGVILGFLNYGSIYFFIKTLNLPGMESSFVFPVNNVAIVASSALVAWVVFRETLSRKNMFGLLLALIAIALISLQLS